MDEGALGTQELTGERQATVDEREFCKDIFGIDASDRSSASISRYGVAPV
jgi:hypothetical protein